MDVEITLEREHKCKAIEKCDFAFIQTLHNQKGWYWHFIENKNTLKERVTAHEIYVCPYCGEPLAEPKPLTLNELRGRDGEPVWVVDKHGEKTWALVDDGWVVSNRSEWNVKAYGEGFICYDHPPKEPRP